MEILVKKARRGDAEAFITLIEENKQSMYKVARGFLQNEEDAADAMAETVLNCYEKIGMLKDNAYFKTWMIRILINNCNTLYHTQKRFQSQVELKEPGYLDSYPEENSFFYLLSLLHRDDRVIFQLYFGEEYTTREISEILNMKESTIRSRIHRGKEQLRKQIQREEWA